MQARASSRYVRITPTKARRVIDLVRGRHVEDARRILKFSPIGASRFNLMFGRLPGCSGPIIVEWSPDRPALAQARREAVLATLERAGRPIPADRVVIGPSPYPGGIGVEAVGHYGNIITRSQAAAQTFPLPPAESSAQAT